MIDGKNFFDQPVKKCQVTYESIRKIATGREDDYATSCLLDYIYFKNYCKINAVDLSKPQALDADPKPVQQINFEQILIEQEIQGSISFLKKRKKLS